MAPEKKLILISSVFKIKPVNHFKSYVLWSLYSEQVTSGNKGQNYLTVNVPLGLRYNTLDHFTQAHMSWFAHALWSRHRRTALSVSCPCLVFVRIFQKIVSGVCLSGLCLSRFCLSGRTRTRQSYPDFRCPCPPTSAMKAIAYGSGIT